MIWDHDKLIAPSFFFFLSEEMPVRGTEYFRHSLLVDTDIASKGGFIGTHHSHISLSITYIYALDNHLHL